jgi:hypothetical protein
MVELLYVNIMHVGNRENQNVFKYAKLSNLVAGYLFLYLYSPDEDKNRRNNRIEYIRNYHIY